jgi:hypothetical protein
MNEDDEERRLENENNKECHWVVSHRTKSYQGTGIINSKMRNDR